MAEKIPQAGAAPVRRSYRNILLLSLTQAISGSQQAVVMAIGALVGVKMAPDPSLATVPATAMIVGLALMAGPAAYSTHRLGHQRAFMVGGGLWVLAGLGAAFGIATNSFFVFIAALLVGGAGAAFAQQYRFAVADNVAPEMKGKAISFVLAGGVAAGFVGPALSRYGRTWVPGLEYAGSFFSVAGLGLLAVFVLTQIRLARADAADQGPKSDTPLWALIRSPQIFIPVITGMASYGLMTFVMIAAPLAMVVVCQYSPDSATTAIQWHIVAMYAPSFFTGPIISRIGARAVTGIGLSFILASALIALNGTSIPHFDFGLILLGLGWNFGFIGSTAMLSQGYRPADAAKVQWFNEQLVFGTMAVASISSGVLLQTIGWQAVNVLTIPTATFAIALLAWGEWHAKRAVPA